jgi:hypothetical protein
MRWAAKARQDKLEWSILDVEQDEWERRLADLGVAAAANGFPVYPAAPVDQNVGIRVPRDVRRILPAVVILTLLGSLAGGLAGYGVWHRAQAGIARLQGDVANAVKVESLHETGGQRLPAAHESVQAVEFLGGAAQATVLVTRTLAAGDLSVQPELRFYVQTPKGWRRSDPIAGFWGSTETLDTAHLHFVFGRRDRTVVEQVAPNVEAVYATLRHATGLALTGAGPDLAGSGLLTIEIAPDVFTQFTQSGGGRIRLTSPALYPAAEQERAGILGRLLRLVLTRQLMDTAAQTRAVKLQWQPLVQGLGTWLADSDRLPFAPAGEDVTPRRPCYGLRSVWQLADLIGDPLRYDPHSRSLQIFTLISDLDLQKQRAAAAAQLIDYIAGTYGIDALPRLRQGLAQYEDWEELAPAALGVSAAELEEGWHAALCEGAPLRTFQ